MKARFLQGISWSQDKQSIHRGIVIKICEKKTFRGRALVGREPIEVYSVANAAGVVFEICEWDIVSREQVTLEELLTHKHEFCRDIGKYFANKPEEYEKILNGDTVKSLDYFAYSIAKQARELVRIEPGNHETIHEQ
jgi:hypothetical protein